MYTRIRGKRRVALSPLSRELSAWSILTTTPAVISLKTPLYSKQAPPEHHPQRTLKVPTDRCHNQNYAPKDQTTLTSRSSPSYASSHTQRSTPSRFWPRINHCSWYDSSSPRGVQGSDSPLDTFFSRSERNTLRQRVSSYRLVIETP